MTHNLNDATVPSAPTGNIEDFMIDLGEEELGESHVVENGDLIIGQASNGHIQVYDKNEGKMVMHINCSGMCSDDEMVETVLKLMELVKKYETV